MFSNFENFKAIRNKAESDRVKEKREHEILRVSSQLGLMVFPLIEST